MGTPKLYILSEQMRGTSFSLTLDRYVIGRSDDCDICISDPTISGQHCTLIKQEDGSFVLQDEGSTNGTKVNGNQIDPAQNIPLKNGDILQIGGIEILFDDIHGERVESRTVSVINLDDTGTDKIKSGALNSAGNKFTKRRSASLRRNDSSDNMMKLILAIVGGIAILGILAFLFIK